MKPDSDKDKSAIQDGTIDPDVPADVKEPEESKPDPRQEAFDAVVENVEKDRIEEMEIEVDPEQDPDPDPELKADPEPETDPDVTKDPEPDQAEEMVKVVVDGQESEVPLSKIKDAGIRTLQKESSADASLAEAKQLLKEVRELKAAKPADPEPDEDVSGMTDEELLEAIRYGEDDVALAAVKALKGRSATVEPIDIDRKIDERLERKSYDDIIGRFSKTPDDGGYSDVFEDATLREYARIKVNELIAQGNGDDKTWETYQKAGDWVRETILGQKPKPKTLEAKKDKKRKIDSINTASSITPDADKETEIVDLEKNRSDTIAKMQADREAQLR